MSDGVAAYSFVNHQQTVTALSWPTTTTSSDASSFLVDESERTLGHGSFNHIAAGSVSINNDDDADDVQMLMPLDCSQSSPHQHQGEDCYIRSRRALGAVLRLYHYVSRTMPEFRAFAEKASITCCGRKCQPLLYLDILGRSMSNILFISNPIVGFALLGALFSANTYYATMALLGTTSAICFATWLGLDRHTIYGGLYGFSGFLLGALIAAFDAHGDWNWQVVFPVILTSVFSVLLFAAFTTYITVPYGVPPLGIPFTIAGLLWCLAFFSSMYLPTTLVAEAHGSVGYQKIYMSTEMYPYSATELGRALFRGYALLVFDSSVTVGIVVLSAAFLASPILALHSLAGASTGLTFTVLTGSPAPALASLSAKTWLGRWPALYGGSMAVDGIYVGLVMAMFWLPGRRTLFMTVIMGLLTAMVKVALTTALYPWGLPTLALPFCFTMMSLLVNHRHMPRLLAIDLGSVTVPEDHLRRFKTVRRMACILRDGLYQANTAGDDAGAKGGHAAKAERHANEALKQRARQDAALLQRCRSVLGATQLDASVRVPKLKALGMLRALAEGTDCASDLPAWCERTCGPDGGVSWPELHAYAATVYRVARAQRLANAFFEALGAGRRDFLYHLEVSAVFSHARLELGPDIRTRLYSRSDYKIERRDLVAALIKDASEMGDDPERIAGGAAYLAVNVESGSDEL